ncbi:MAG TPA: class I SAM-dependent methyltransferase [Candidatus Limnocylindrales bacterium]|nr:class I SAM-dependent methyltransferase [Candidatus Limnocylindrales bacterium]
MERRERGVDAVRDQFGPAAEAYLASAVHAQGEDLAKLVEFLAPAMSDTVLDLGCGVGHTLRKVAPKVRLAVGADATAGMLEGARTLMARENITNVTLVVTAAEALPFLDGSFDGVTCRLAAHHFADVPRAFSEIARVLKPGGRFVLSDNYAPDDPDLDRWINTLEKLRDPSHAREHTTLQWRALLERSGFSVTGEERSATPLETEPWLARSRTPEPEAGRVREMLRTAPDAARRTFAVHAAGFTLLKVVLRAER